MATTAGIEEELLDILRNELAVDAATIEESSELIADLGLDSVAFAVALVAIEERLGVRLSEKELMGCTTVGDVVCAVAQHESDRA